MICPRCQQERAERFYGPCVSCRIKLRALKPPPRDPRFVRVVNEFGGNDTIKVEV